MKKYLISFIAVLAVMMVFAACKTNTESKTDNTGKTSSVPVSDITENGKVTDKDGIIGDEDDRNSEASAENPVSKLGDVAGDVIEGAGKAADKAGEAAGDVADGIGDAAEKAGQGADDVLSGAGDAINNAGQAANNAADGAASAADDLGEAAKNAADNAADTVR